jgi:hypothetical protein
VYVPERYAGCVSFTFVERTSEEVDALTEVDDEEDVEDDAEE